MDACQLIDEVYFGVLATCTDDPAKIEARLVDLAPDVPPEARRTLARWQASLSNWHVHSEPFTFERNGASCSFC